MIPAFVVNVSFPEKKATIMKNWRLPLENNAQRLRDGGKFENQKVLLPRKMSKAFLYHKYNTMFLYGNKDTVDFLVKVIPR